ncbi:MAG: TolC family protein [Bacteroidia bacterium]
MKKINILKSATLFVLILFTQIVFSQNKTYPVNLETVLKLAGADNLIIKEYELKYQQSLADQSKAKEWWLPSIYFGATTHYLDGAAMNADGKIFQPVNRNNLWAGFGLSAEWDFSKGIYGTLAAKQKADAVKYQSQAERNRAILKAIEAYYDLQLEQLKYAALQSLVNQSDSLTQQIKIQVDAGLRYQSEYLLAQSNYNHIKISLLQTKVEWQKKSAELVNLLNMDGSISLVSSDDIIIPLKLSINIPDTAQQKKVFEKRLEYLSLQSSLFSLQTQRKIVTTGLLMPKLKLGTEDALFGKIASPYYNTYQLNAALVWQLSLGRFVYNGDVKKQDANILVQQNQIEQFKNQFQLESNKGIAQLQSAEEQMKIANEAVKLSAEALQQSIERQKLGTVKPFEVFQAQQFYMQAQVDYLKSASEFNKAQYVLLIVTGGNL